MPWHMKITNEEIYRKPRTKPINKQMQRKHCRFIGHIPQNDATTLTLDGRRKRVRPPTMWRRKVETEINQLGLGSWPSAEVAGKYHGSWRRMLDKTLCVTQAQRGID